jgi:hypothetical protein
MELDLTGWRHFVRQSSLVVVGGLAALSALLHLTERHRVDRASTWGEESYDPDWGPAHSLAGESFGMPVIVPLVILATVWWAFRGRLPRAILPALLAAGNLVAVVVAWVNAHLFEDTDTRVLTAGAIITSFLLAAAGIWLFLVEIVVPFLERRRLEASDPVFPTARLV